jgi:hypothetical protein
MPKTAASLQSRRAARIAFSFLALTSLLAVALTAQKADTSPELFSSVMQRVSAQPEFRERVLQGIQDVPKVGEFLSPDLVDRLRVLILGKEWQRVDHFPALTVAGLNKSVGVAVHVAGKPAAPLQAADLLDTAEYPLGQAETIDLDHPATTPTYANDPATAQRDIGFNLTMGDGPDPALAPMHSESRQLAAVLNRLAMNSPANDPGQSQAVVTLNGKRFTDSSALLRELAESGHQVSITDDAYFANFGHLHDGGREVMMPFWIDTQIAVPASRRALLLPVSHSEQELHIRGPKWNADVSFYFGIDGKAEFRTMDQLDQAWVMKRDAHTYTGADAVEVTRLAGLIVQTYAHLHAAHPTIPFGGYYAFGVCQDVVAAIEMKMTGATTLFPNTADDSFFTDPRDAEINALIKRLPKDRDGKPPDAVRIFGSLPIGSSDAELATVSIPGLGSDLIAVHDAWTQGKLEHVGERRRMRNWLYGLGALLALGLVWVLRHKAQRR